MTTARPFDAVALTRLHRVQSIAPSPCGTWAVLAVARLCADAARYVADLWSVSCVDVGAPPEQLTRGEWSDEAPRFRKDGAIGFLSDRPTGGARGDGRRQLWLLPPRGDPYPLTDEPLGVEDFRFAARADRLVAIAPVIPGVAQEDQRRAEAARSEAGPTGLHYARMPVRFWDDWLGPAAPHFIAYRGDGGDRRDLTPSADREYRERIMPGRAWSLAPDGARVVAPASRPGPGRLHDADLHVIETDTGRIAILGGEEGAAYDAPVIAPGGDRIACARQLRRPGSPGRKELWLFEGGDARGRPAAPGWDVWPVPHAFTDDEQGVVATADERGEVPVSLVDLDSGRVDRITDQASGGSHENLHVVGDRVIGLRHRILHPPEPFSTPLSPGRAPELLASLSGFTEADGKAIARVESLSAPGDGGDPVQSFFVAPAAPAAEPRSALVWIHGGPVAQNADGWHWRWNPLVPAAAGYAIALPNPRGSTGFGQEFLEGIWNNAWGDACYRDVLAVADAVAERGDVDGDRMAAMGGSFGGYMANWIGATTDRFRCLVSHAGIYHLTAFHGTTDRPAWFAEQMGGAPEGDFERFERYSPHREVGGWRSPVLVIHGARDFRVPVSEALLLFEDLTRLGVDAELLVFPDENHWIRKPQNARQWYGAILDFLANHLAKETSR